MPILLANTAFAILMLLAGCAVLLSILLRRSYRYFGRQSKSRVITGLEHLPRPKSQWEGVYHDVDATIDRHEVEMAEMVRDMTGQLNTKIYVLEQLISESQQQIDRMEELLQEVRIQQSPQEQDPV